MDPYACPEVATPPLEHLKEVLMYEWMRTHSIALKHWHEGQKTGSAWLNYKHHQQFEQYTAAAAYCQARVFELNHWPFPIPYLAFPDPEDSKKTIKYSPMRDWYGVRFQNHKVSLNSRWINTIRQQIPPNDPYLPPGKSRIFQSEPYYRADPSYLNPSSPQTWLA